MTELKSIKIGGFKYKIIHDYKFVERFDRSAHCDNTSHEIRIGLGDMSGRYKIDAKLQFIMHEVLHAIDHIYNGTKLDEDIIQRLSQGMFQVMMDNPKLLEMFL